jgi:lysozyme
MERQVTLFQDGQVAEFRDGELIRLVSTEGNIHALLQALRFSRTSRFTVSCEASPLKEEIAQRRGGQRINNVGLKLLTSFEGCKLTAYDDGVGVWTIGYGHTAGVAPGMSITQNEAEDFLRRDLEIYESYVEDLVNVPLSSNQFSSLVCFCYNTGPGQDGFGGSTLLKLLNDGDYEGSAKQFLRWNKGGGKSMLGLTRRRLAEQALFLDQPWEFALSYDGPLDITGSVASHSVGARTLSLTNPLMQGEDVRRLQEALKNAGFDIKPDGLFGNDTEKAVRHFQQQKGLTVDGQVGPKTLKSLGL